MLTSESDMNGNAIIGITYYLSDNIKCIVYIILL